MHIAVIEAAVVVVVVVVVMVMRVGFKRTSTYAISAATLARSFRKRTLVGESHALAGKLVRTD